MMNWQGIVLITTIVIMMALVFVITRFLASSPHGLYSSFIRGYFRGNERLKKWISEYNVYYWSLLLNICLIVTILALCGSLSQMKFLSRPELALAVSIPLWYSIYRCTLWYQKKIEFASKVK